MSTGTPANCSGLANSGVPAKAPGVEIADSEPGSLAPLASPRSIIFGRYAAFVLQAHHDVSRFDIPVDEILFVNGLQPGSDLGDNFQRQLDLQPAGALDQAFQRLALDKLHGVEVIAAAPAEVKD